MAFSFIHKRLFRNIAVYFGSAWVIIEVAIYFESRFNLPYYYIDILMILIGFGLISFIINEWVKFSQNKKVNIFATLTAHATTILIGLTSSYSYYNYSIKNEIQFTRNEDKKISIAVLPFKNISQNSTNEWLGDALCEQIIDQLDLIKSIDVKSRSASFYFKNKDLNPVQIANLLGVNTILDGSVIVQDSAIRISIKLINPFTGSQIWSETFDKSIKDVLSLQTEIALNIATKINADISIQEKNELINNLTQNPDAFESFMKGKYHFNLVTMADNKRAHDYFEKAIQLDSNMAVAYAYLGLTYDMFGGYWMGLEPDSAYRVINNLADKAIKLNPKLALGYFLRSNYEYFYERNYKKGLETATKAFNMTDSREDFIWLYCMMLSINKKSNEAIEILTSYIKKNPTSAQAYQGLCGVKLIKDGKNKDVPLEEFFEPCNKATELDPSMIYSKYYLAELMFMRHDYKSSIKYWNELYHMAPAPHFVEGIFRAHYYLGDTTTAMQYFNQLKIYSTQLKIPYVMTRAYATLGDTENALKYLQEAYAYRDIEIVNLWFDASLDPIRGNPEFKKILSQLKYADKD